MKIMEIKKLKFFFLLLIFLLVNINSYSQIIWSEDFENYSSGTTTASDYNNPPVGVDWVIQGGGGTSFEVRDNHLINGSKSFVAKNTDGEKIWETETIDISSYSDVYLSIRYKSENSLESSGSKYDYIKMDYQIDGGSWISFLDNHGNVSGIRTAMVNSLSGNTLRIRVRIRNGHLGWFEDNEYYSFDDVIVRNADCKWKICLTDSKRNGWNGGYVTVTTGGVTYGLWAINGSSGCAGAGPECFDIPVSIGDDIIIDYTQGAESSSNKQYRTQNAYLLIDSYGNLRYSSGDDGTIPVDHTYTNVDCEDHALTPNEQDCLGAIPICGDTISTTVSYTGQGNIPFEINGCSSCLTTGELNDVWYIFTVQEDGDLGFVIDPNDNANDYDWAVFDLTSSTCADIANDASLQVSCNYDGGGGNTGPTGSTSDRQELKIPVSEGDVYVINVSNFSSNQSGYLIDFTMSSGIVIDVTPPELDTITNSPTCGQNQITAWFTENVDTLTVNAGDFTVTGPGGPYSISEVHGVSGTETDRGFTLTLGSQLTAGGTYSLVFSGQVDDVCGNSVTGNSLDFTVDGVYGSITAFDDTDVHCANSANGSATVAASGGDGSYTYLWSTGAITASVTSLVANTYYVTVSDGVGVCYDVDTVIIAPDNSSIAIGTWAGTTNNNWGDCTNWGYGTVPSASIDVIIPTGCTNYPIVPADGLINGTTGACNSVRIENTASLTMSDGHSLTVDNSNLIIDAGGTLIVEGNLTFQNGANLFQSGGDIIVGGDFTNKANVSITDGNTTFNGAGEQIIGGSQVTSFNDLTINNSNNPNSVKLESNIVVNHNLSMGTGDLNIGTYEIDLRTTGMLLNETASSRIKALDASNNPVSGGYVVASRIDPSGDIAGLGLEVTPASPLGNTTIKRGHDILQGTGSFTANTSVLRYFDITASNTNKSVIVNDLVFNYFDAELNGHLDGTLIMFQEIQETWGGTPGPVFWHPLTTANDAAANTASATTSNNFLSTTKITLGSNTKPLPVELVEFKAICNEKSVNLKWKTVSEKNNNNFTIEKSIDGVLFKEIGFVEGEGNSNDIKLYSYIDVFQNETVVYYRLKQTDFNGDDFVSHVIRIDCNTVNQGKQELLVYPNPASNNSEVFIELKGFNNVEEVSLVVLDVYGKIIYSQFVLTEGTRTIIESSKLNSLNSGTYIVVGISNDEIYRKKLIIN